MAPTPHPAVQAFANLGAAAFNAADAMSTMSTAFNYFSTNTMPGVWNGYWQPVYQLPPPRPEWPLVSPSLERDRRNLVFVRAGYMPEVKHLPRRYDTPTAQAPRRVVVPHGFVSWVRAGTRRPL